MLLRNEKNGSVITVPFVPKWKKDKERPMFTISVGDVQCVAVAEFDRMLTDEEIEHLRDCIGDNVPWYDSVLTAIDDHIVNKG